MQKIVVSDTSCLILFHKIEELELLQKVFGHITITETVSEEFKGGGGPCGRSLSPLYCPIRRRHCRFAA